MHGDHRRWADELFIEPPPRWGLRGDPFLWQELHERLLDLPRPASADAFTELLRLELRALCGLDVLAERRPSLRIERYPEGGRSGGLVSPAAWRDELVPLLAGRFDR
ncbi:MAG: hypothetical protein IT196_17290 [Acidimicrobiales bacterium]|nr:hypothetical protein [Acidimicrobiales bacterium]